MATAVANSTPSLALDMSVLVLNRLYMVVHVVGVRRAMRLLFCDHAEVIHDEEGIFANYDFRSWRERSEIWADQQNPHDDWLHAVHFKIQVPRVIRLLAFEQMPRKNLYPSRQAIFARDAYRCQYCGRRFPLSKLSLDHVVPRRDGGQSTWENMVCACCKCNVKKGGRTPRQARMKLLNHPVRPKFSPLILQKVHNPKYRTWLTWLGKEAKSLFTDDFDAA